MAIVAQCDNEQQIVPATASPAEHTCYAGKQQMHTESLLLIKIFRCTNWQTPWSSSGGGGEGVGKAPPRNGCWYATRRRTSQLGGGRRGSGQSFHPRVSGTTFLYKYNRSSWYWVEAWDRAAANASSVSKGRPGTVYDIWKKALLEDSVHHTDRDQKSRIDMLLIEEPPNKGNCSRNDFRGEIMVARKFSPRCYPGRASSRYDLVSHDASGIFSTESLTRALRFLFPRWAPWFRHLLQKCSA